jgi:hypothetical protein
LSVYAEGNLLRDADYKDLTRALEVREQGRLQETKDRNELIGKNK